MAAEWLDPWGGGVRSNFEATPCMSHRRIHTKDVAFCLDKRSQPVPNIPSSKKVKQIVSFDCVRQIHEHQLLRAAATGKHKAYCEIRKCGMRGNE